MAIKEYNIKGRLSEDCKSVILSNGGVMKRILNFLIDKDLDITIRELITKRSIQQNRWLWGVVYVRIRQFLKRTQGEDYKPETIHEYTKQCTMNDNLSTKSIVFSEEEWNELIDTLHTLNKSSQDTSLILKNVGKKAICNVTVNTILGKRFVESSSIKSTKSLSTKEFNILKEKLQHDWGKIDCDIPDPIGNCQINDYL